MLNAPSINVPMMPPADCMLAANTAPDAVKPDKCSTVGSQ